jgi:hypothetical protein
LINKVYKQQKLAAIIIDFMGDLTSTTFFTAEESPLQVGMIVKKINEPVNAHRHNIFPRNVSGTSEFLFVLEGGMALTIYDENFEDPERFNIPEGSGVLLLSGAHAIEFEVPTKLIEVKQGPYEDKIDKVYLTELGS